MDLINLLIAATLIYAIYSNTHFFRTFKYRFTKSATKRDYSQTARYVGNGGYFTGRFDFLVSVCPCCHYCSEWEGCYNCNSHKVRFTKYFYFKCPDCHYENTLQFVCAECGAGIALPFVNFYRGTLIAEVVEELIEAPALRGRERPEQALVEELEMPTKIIRPKNISSIPRPKNKSSTRH